MNRVVLQQIPRQIGYFFLILTVSCGYFEKGYHEGGGPKGKTAYFKSITGKGYVPHLPIEEISYEEMMRVRKQGYAWWEAKFDKDGFITSYTKYLNEYYNDKKYGLPTSEEKKNILTIYGHGDYEYNKGRLSKAIIYPQAPTIATKKHIQIFDEDGDFINSETYRRDKIADGGFTNWRRTEK